MHGHPKTKEPLPGQSDLSLLPGNVSCLLCSFHSSVHLLSDLTCPEGDQVLPFAAHQDVLFVLSFFLCAIRKGGAAIAVTFVAKPFPFILQPVRPPTYTKPCPLVILPLSTVGFCCRGIHIIVSDSQLRICISKTGKMKRHSGFANAFSQQSYIFYLTLRRPNLAFGGRNASCTIM